VANQLNGDVTIKVVGGGLWRSSDGGKTWQRIDDNKISDCLPTFRRLSDCLSQKPNGIFLLQTSGIS
jgi:photosystem II stability/assembly factor-like uncharacterized protein